MTGVLFVPIKPEGYDRMAVDAAMASVSRAIQMWAARLMAEGEFSSVQFVRTPAPAHDRAAIRLVLA